MEEHTAPDTSAPHHEVPAVKTYDMTTPEAIKLKRQLEYYFSDSNYSGDKFMRGKAAENNGYIPVDEFLKFNRVKQITSDINFVNYVFQQIPDLEVKDGKVKRTKPIAEVDPKERMERSIYIKGFTPNEELSIDVLNDLLLPYANPLSIYRRRDKATKKFRGSIYVEFKTPEEGKKIADLKELDFKGQKLTIETQQDHYNRKAKEAAEKGKTYEPPYANQHKKQKEKKEKVEEKPFEPTIEQGLLIEIKNVPADTTFADLKAYFARFGQVQYVDTEKLSENQCLIRFLQASATTAAYEEISAKKMEIKGNILEARLITGDEEDKYWKEKIMPGLLSKSNKNSNRGRGGGKNKRKRAQSNQNTNQKKQKKSRETKTTVTETDPSGVTTTTETKVTETTPSTTTKE
jgi:RNA recognition motif-containing protein